MVGPCLRALLACIAGIVSQAQALEANHGPRASLFVRDTVKGTGRAPFGLARMPDKPHCALFLHTGALSGLLAQAAVIVHRLEP